MKDNRDKRDASRIRKCDFKGEQSESVSDYLSLVTLVCGVAALMLRQKICAWIALFSTLCTVANTPKKDMDFKQTFASLMFCIMVVVTNYLSPQPGQSSP